MITPEQKRFERAAILLANWLEISSEAEYQSLPCKVRECWELLEYKELIRPLVYRDRVAKEWPEQKIANYYSITRQEVRTILSKGRNLVKAQPANAIKATF